MFCQVALIPYNDERLKPRRTKMKILCALLICGFVLGLLTYMFLPGDVVVVPIDARIVNASIAQTNWVLENKHWGTSQIYWKVNITVQNHNRVLTITVDMLNVLLKIDVSEQRDVDDVFYIIMYTPGIQYTLYNNVQTVILYTIIAAII